MKTDIVMWAKNGAAYLPQVLSQIDNVIPAECIGNKIFVDDHSIDETVKIAKYYSWQVYPNVMGGISSGANTALSHIKTPFFVSVEQDVFLASNWWLKIPRLLRGSVAVASGVRLPDKPKSLRRIEQYTTEKYYVQTKFNQRFLYAKTVDNTIYNTDIIRKIGGFPYIKNNVGVDSALHQKVLEAGYFWDVNFSVVSTHLRNGLRNELKHHFWYGKSLSVKEVLPRALYSPIRAAKITYEKKCLEILCVYPLLRAATLAGSISACLSAHSKHI